VSPWPSEASSLSPSVTLSPLPSSLPHPPRLLQCECLSVSLSLFDAPIHLHLPYPMPLLHNSPVLGWMPEPPFRCHSPLFRWVALSGHRGAHTPSYVNPSPSNTLSPSPVQITLPPQKSPRPSPQSRLCRTQRLHSWRRKRHHPRSRPVCPLPLPLYFPSLPPLSSGAPLARVVFRDPYRYKLRCETFIATEGLHTGAFIYCGKKATLTVGNVLPVGQCPEGTIVCNIEEKLGDRGALARTSGGFATVIGHAADDAKTRIRLPSGAKKTVSSSARASIGIVAGGGRMDKPLLKAGRAYHKYKAKRYKSVLSLFSPLSLSFPFQLASYSWCRYESRRPSSRWWKPPAHRKSLHHCPLRRSWPESRSHRCSQGTLLPLFISITLSPVPQTGLLRGTVKTKEA